MYRRVPAGALDPLQKPLGPVYTLLRRKYYFDELYGLLFVRPAYWLAETVVYRWIDRGLIDGFLHAVGRLALRIGSALRNYIDLPVVNGTADRLSEAVKRAGREFRALQTGRVQQYLIVGMTFTALLVGYVLVRKP